MGARHNEIRGEWLLHGLRVMLLSVPALQRWRCKLRPRRFVYPHQSRTANSISELQVGTLSLILLALVLEPIVIVGANAHSTTAAFISTTGGHPKDEFSRHFVIKPQVFHGRHKRAISNTLEEPGAHASHITLSYVHSGESVIADLKLNEELIPQGHFLRYQNKNGGIGENAMKTFNKTDINLCHYQGAIRGKANSRVAVSTCNGGINGLVYDGTESYYIYSDSDGELDSDHYLFRNSDKLYNATCGVRSDRNHEPEDFLLSNTPNRILRYKRSSKTENIIRGPYNANRHSSFVELVIVVDNKVYKGLGENMKKVHNHCKDIANIVNALYVPLNIFVALVGVVVWNESNEIELSSDGDDTLKKFLQYRRNSLLSVPNDNAQLLTKEQFDGGVVGKALKGPICTYEYSGGVSMEHSQITAIVATTVAHEMGHNFGMEHDSADCKCDEEKCIMSASSTSLVPHHWSSCSIDQLNVAFSHGMNYCLRNKPAQLFESPQCGNGFVEPGEQCDCGLPEYCENSCCDPNTCMLHGNASCATGECCDLTTCRPKSPGTECRSAEGECDLPEYCTGESEFCPSDVYKRDTEVCDNGHAYCYKGSCRSRTNQCKILWGPSGESSDHCYGKNVEGNRHGTCRYDRLKNEYQPCEKEDVLCGMLHCKHLNERLEFGMESVAILSHSFMNHEGTIIPCRTAIVDLGLQSPDPGLAPNGAKCGTNKMCVNQKCVAIEALQRKGIGPRCPNDCNGQGVCNSEGHCHCNLGYAYPDCSNPGQGGSVDSGPASNPNGRIVFTRAMYIIFLGCVPCIAIISFLTYYWKQNHPLQFRKATNVTKVTLKKSPPSQGMPPSNPSTEDMNSALLKTQNDDKSLQNSMFGKFKGFTLKPLPNATTNMTNNVGAKVALVHPVAKTPDTIAPTPPSCPVPIRAAPPVPKRPLTIVENEEENLVKPLNSMKMVVAPPPALPPPNASFQSARPLISEPVLKTSTCTAKELESVKQTGPMTRPLVATQKIAPQVKFQEPEMNKDSKEGTIKRIASFLKNDKKPNNTALAAKQSFKAKPIINREKLKDIQISSPIPIVDGDLNEQTNIVQRTQSMRDPASFDRKANVQTFGSMRQPGAARPKSVVGLRPKSPPPRPPVPPIVTGPGKPPSNYLKRPVTEIHDVSSSESDNIYAEVDEYPHSGPNDRSNVVADSDDSMGLLSEIVNEMEKKNGQTIYSNTVTSLPETSPTFNVIQIGENVRTPVARVAPSIPESLVSKTKPNTFSSFKADRPPTTLKSRDTLSSAKTKPDSTHPATNKPSAPASNQGPQLVNKPSTKKTISSTTKPVTKTADTTSSSSSSPSAAAASVPAGKKNLVSQRAELWESNSKGKVGNKVSNSTSSSNSNSHKSSSADKTSSTSTASDPSKSSSGSGAGGSGGGTKSATINKRVKSFTTSAAAPASSSKSSSSSAAASAKPHTSLNKRKVGDSQSSNVSASVNRFELKNNKLDNATNVRFATNTSNNSSAASSSSSSKPNNSASA